MSVDDRTNESQKSSKYRREIQQRQRSQQHAATRIVSGTGIVCSTYLLVNDTRCCRYCKVCIGNSVLLLVGTDVRRLEYTLHYTDRTVLMSSYVQYLLV